MIILIDTTGITVKGAIGDEDHVRIGVTQTALHVDGVRRAIRDNTKPHVELTINDLVDLHEEVQRMKR